MTLRRARSERGVTLLEVTLMLLATVTLLAALAPTLSAIVFDAKRARALLDEQNIKTAVDNYKTDTLLTKFYGTPLTLMDPINLLCSDGDIPEQGSGSNAWISTLTTTDRSYIERHLVTNTPGYLTATWKGAYLNSPVDPDPWGNRYCINTEWMGGLGTEDTVVLSAGPDEEIDTADGQDGLAAGDDDILFLVEN